MEELGGGAVFSFVFNQNLRLANKGQILMLIVGFGEGREAIFVVEEVYAMMLIKYELIFLSFFGNNGELN